MALVVANHARSIYFDVDITFSSRVSVRHQLTNRVRGFLRQPSAIPTRADPLGRWFIDILLVAFIKSCGMRLKFLSPVLCV